MGDELLVRAYDVGVGDCIYVRIPNEPDGFHLLIDCGTKGKAHFAALKEAIDHLEKNELPSGEVAGKKRLDLLVATHRHEDHIQGFDPSYFGNVEIKNIWLSAAMNSDHPQAKKTRNLHALATAAVRDLEARGLATSPQMQMLASMYGVRNDDAMKALKKDLPESMGIEPLYVHAGMSSSEVGVEIHDASIRVLAPEEDIDGYYLGKNADHTLRSFKATRKYFAERSTPVADVMPTNISEVDFKRLRSRLLSNTLAFAETDSSIQNNMSVVLLIQWRGRRLLFVGDAEWHGEYKKKKHNGSWNVMWNTQRDFLNAPVDFLKVGHHGSINATPRRKDKDETYEVNQILEAILPLPEPGVEPEAKAIVSTERSYYSSIPESEMLVEIGKRVGNTRRYLKELSADPDFDPVTDISEYKEREKEWLGEPQPWRTDLERILTGEWYVDVKIKPSDNHG